MMNERTAPEFFDKFNASKLRVADLFQMQADLQKEMFGYDLPKDSVDDFEYSMLALIGEMGEVLAADKRWKNIRKGGFYPEQKIEELCDCMAFLINMILFSGITPQYFCEAFIMKNKKNFDRLKK